MLAAVCLLGQTHTHVDRETCNLEPGGHTLVKEECHKVEVYSCLWLLMTEVDRGTFSDHLQLYKEPSFTQYFQVTYANRTGE